MKTIKNASESEYIVNKSRFIGFASHIKDEKGASALTEHLRHRYAGSDHVAFAFRLIDGTYRFSDDGEPKNSAGKPILNIIEKNGLYNVYLGVARWFGGIKLGVGGLVRAYTHAASEALNKQPVLPLVKSVRLIIECSYENHDALKGFIKSKGALVESESFGSSVKISLLSPESVHMEILGHRSIISKEITEEGIFEVI